MVGAGDVLWAASTPTDTLLRIVPETGAVTRFDGGDGPSALASWVEPDGHPMLAVAHAWTPEVWILDGASGERRRTVPAPAYATGLVVDPKRRLLLVAETVANSVVALGLDDGKQRWRTEVLPDPRPMAWPARCWWWAARARASWRPSRSPTGRRLPPSPRGRARPSSAGTPSRTPRDIMGGKAAAGAALVRGSSGFWSPASARTSAPIRSGWRSRPTAGWGWWTSPAAPSSAISDSAPASPRGWPSTRDGADSTWPTERWAWCGRSMRGRRSGPRRARARRCSGPCPSHRPRVFPWRGRQPTTG